ncbi:cobalt-precorrin-6A reductase [Pannonibacter phragmitetus]|uniref:cobalt-precorrin-6A reductase n=1 Tax=Pannonibacter phragmitetus TaxID=121719 RepID=UPI0013DE0650
MVSQGCWRDGGRSRLGTRHILILAGTADARALAERLVQREDLTVTLSLAGRTLDPAALPAPVRSGGFGGAEGLAAYLRQENISLLIDATHPFARRMTANAVEASQQTGIPLLKLERPAWTAQPGDNWTPFRTIREAVEALGTVPRRVFLATGRQGASAIEAAPQHHYLIRSVDPVDPPPAVPFARNMLARGPFTVEAELDLLTGHGIDVIICKNSGGEATYAKLEAARRLGLPVMMIERSAHEAPLSAGSADEAMTLISHWLEDAAKRGV